MSTMLCASHRVWCGRARSDETWRRGGHHKGKTLKGRVVVVVARGGGARDNLKVGL